MLKRLSYNIREKNGESQHERVTKFRKIRQKTKETEDINEKMIVAMNFSSKSQKLNSKKDSTDRYPNTSTESLLSNKKT